MAFTPKAPRANETRPMPGSSFSAIPSARGLYDPAREKDACGLAMVATLRGTAGHDIIQLALEALRHLEHRGAIGGSVLHGLTAFAGFYGTRPPAGLELQRDPESSRSL